MVSYLFNERESGVLVIVMPWKGEMFIEGSTGGFQYVAAVGVDTQISGGFRFSDVLGLWA